MKEKTPFGKFDQFIKNVLQVPHSEIKAKLEAEKQAKKRKKSKKSSASGRVSDDWA